MNRDQPRRPKARCLADLYDAGYDAAHTGGTNPFDPPEVRGDDMRQYLWSQGHEDAEKDLTALI